MMAAVTDAQFGRLSKWAARAGVIGSCLAGALFFLDGTLRTMTAGAVAGLAVAVVAWFADAYWRRGQVDVNRAVVVEKKARKARRAKSILTIGAVLGCLLVIPVRVFHAEWLVGGFIIGFFFFLGLMLSPLFWSLPKRRAANSAVSRMTSMERAARTPYK
jgi:hypothetical protein